MGVEGGGPGWVERGKEVVLLPTLIEHLLSPPTPHGSLYVPEIHGRLAEGKSTNKLPGLCVCVPIESHYNLRSRNQLYFIVQESQVQMEIET